MLLHDQAPRPAVIEPELAHRLVDPSVGGQAVNVRERIGAVAVLRPHAQAVLIRARRHLRIEIKVQPCQRLTVIPQESAGFAPPVHHPAHQGRQIGDEIVIVAPAELFAKALCPGGLEPVHGRADLIAVEQYALQRFAGLGSGLGQQGFGCVVIEQVCGLATVGVGLVATLQGRAHGTGRFPYQRHAEPREGPAARWHVPAYHAGGIHFRRELQCLRAPAVSHVGPVIFVSQYCRAFLGPIPEAARAGFEEPPFDAAAQARLIAWTQHAELGQLDIRNMGGGHLQTEHLGFDRGEIHPPGLACRKFKRRHLRESLSIR